MMNCRALWESWIKLTNHKAILSIVIDRAKIIFILVVFIFTTRLSAQDSTVLHRDFVSETDTIHREVPQSYDSSDFLDTSHSDSVRTVNISGTQFYVTDEEDIEIIISDKALNDPTHTIWLGTVIPGYGQIANKKYWKLPIVYGGFLGCFYAINWNSNQYSTYKNAYLDIIDDDDTTNSHLDILPEGYTMDSYGGQSAYTGLLKSGMEKSRYNRDLSIIISVAYYGLTLVDAFVDAHLADFDVSTDLSMKLRPSIMHDRLAQHHFSKSSYAFGLTACLKF